MAVKTNNSEFAFLIDRDYLCSKFSLQTVATSLSMYLPVKAFQQSCMTEDGLVVFKLLRDDGDCSGDWAVVLAALDSAPRN